jgi:hypothetical protein
MSELYGNSPNQSKGMVWVFAFGIVSGGEGAKGDYWIASTDYSLFSGALHFVWIRLFLKKIEEVMAESGGFEPPIELLVL